MTFTHGQFGENDHSDTDDDNNIKLLIKFPSGII